MGRIGFLLMERELTEGQLMHRSTDASTFHVRVVRGFSAAAVDDCRRTRKRLHSAVIHRRYGFRVSHGEVFSQ